MRKKLVENGYLKEISVPAARGKWEAQMRHFGRRYRAAADIRSLLDNLSGAPASRDESEPAQEAQSAHRLPS